MRTLCYKILRACLPNLTMVTGMPFCILARNYACPLLRYFRKNTIVPKSLAGTISFRGSIATGVL